MTTNAVNLAKLLGPSATIPAESLSSDIPLGTEEYATAASLPGTASVGDQVFVTETNRLYIWTGQGWYNIALINQTPTWDSGGLPEAAYELDSIGGTATTITLAATDPDGLAVQWTYSIADSGNDLATITNDSNGTFTITAKSLTDILNAGYDSSGGTFDVTFRASDGVNLATALSEFSISFKIAGFGGTNYGYTSGGYDENPVDATFNVIDKFPFASDANATDVGNLTQVRQGGAGQSSAENGYDTGGVTPSWSAVMDKFAFSSDGNASQIGSLTDARQNIAGHSSTENGYAAGGWTPGVTSRIDKFPFAVDGNSSYTADLSIARQNLDGHSSAEEGFSSGGTSPGTTYFDTIDKFPFASDTNASSAATLSVARQGLATSSSATHGYIAGGSNAGATNVIDKFPFASGGTATSVGTLTQNRQLGAGQSSDGYGYSSGGLYFFPIDGGYGLAPFGRTTIDKYPFAADASATSIGDLTVKRFNASGQQY